MLDQVNAALVEIQGALLARALYPAEHPRIREGEDRALVFLDWLLSTRSEITVFAVDDRVIFENSILPSSRNLADSLFGVLRQLGVDSLVLRRGIAREELGQFLDQLASDSAKRGQIPAETPHIGVGSFRDFAPAVPGVEACLINTEELEGATDALTNVWDGVHDAGRLDIGTLRDIVSFLSKAVTESAGAMLPLASLKRHDEYTFVHTINVALLSTALGEALGFSSHQAHELSIAAMLHDVGKRAIPQELLNKAGKFTDEEFQLMRSHPVEGARMLLSLPDVPAVAPVVAFEHHVRADGGGYPKVPRGWRLNLASRIVQLADVFDALRTDRPYRPGQPVSKIIEIMESDVGTFFDADLLLVFLRDVISRGVASVAPAH